MSATTRLDIDLAFSLEEPIVEPTETSTASPDTAAVESEQMTGTITASGLDIEVYSSKPELFVQSRTIRLKDLRVLATALAERGLTVSLSGPDGVIVKLGAVQASVTQRVLTGSAHIGLGSRKALAPLLRRRSTGSSNSPAALLPPATPWPLVPTFDRLIRRKITTTHYSFGAGRPRLFFIVGSETWNGQMPREVELSPGITTIGSSPAADLQLAGLEPFHAQIHHESDDEYVLYSLGEVGGGSLPLPDEHAGGRVLRTGARMEMGQWRIGFFREEYADHGRPYGGRRGGEMGHQKPQPGRHSVEQPAPAPPARDTAVRAEQTPLGDPEI
ncbi:FHA domain-containing protein [Rhodoglobus aureus]|uniref:FHA domain-containing protein n=1 Tax=Rhodoglobus aureus TaxID=191497 RepID=A0ABN1VFK1_9MICO